MTFVIAVNYGGRDEITRAIRRMTADCKEGRLDSGSVTEQVVSLLSGYGRYPGSGSFDPYQRRNPPPRIIFMATCVQ